MGFQLDGYCSVVVVGDDFISFGNSVRRAYWFLSVSHFSQNRDDARQFMKLLHPDLGVGKISAPNSFTRNVIYFFLFFKKRRW